MKQNATSKSRKVKVNSLNLRRINIDDLSFRSLYQTQWGWTIQFGPSIALWKSSEPILAFACDLEPWEVGQLLGGN
jgi:hypothetical protein